jgi:phosphoglycolate phosphatase-like HAD superfamily hydrolase
MHVFLFDIDGTLLSSGGSGRAAMEAALADEFGVPASSDGVTMSGRTDLAILRDLFGIHGIPMTEENRQRFVAAYLRLLPASLARGKGQTLPGITGLLAHLDKTERTALGLLTGNLREGARAKLGHFGLFDYFAFGGFGDLHWERDDVAREALAAVRAHLNGDVCLERLWVIGDTPLDVQCARAIGARSVAVATGVHTVEQLSTAKPDLVFADLSDPTPLLNACL